MKLNSRTAAQDTITVLELSGRFDAYEVPAVKEALQKGSQKEPAHIVVNLTQVNFVDSSALAILVQGLKHCRQNKGDLHLCHLQQPVRIIFELTRLDKAFDIFATEEEAVAAFAGQE